jgi:hypothetical protein
MASDSDFTVTGPGGAVAGTFALSNSDTTLTFTPTSALADGDYDVTVTGQSDADGNAQQVTTTFSFAVGAADTTPPVVGDVSIALTEGGQIHSVPITVSWSASDDVTADADLVHELQIRHKRNGVWTAWSDVALLTGTESSNRVIASWRTYQYRVRTQDQATNWSDWAESATLRAPLFQETDFTRSTGWKRIFVSNAMGDHLIRSSTPGAWAQLTFTGNGVAAVMPAGSGLGTVEICVDPATVDEQCATVNLATFTPTGARRLVKAFAGLDWGTHVLRVTVVSGLVKLDGAATAR